MPKIKINMEFKPTLLITANKEKLGSLTFDKAEDMGKFMSRLTQAIKQIIKEFEDEKERTKDRSAKCRS
jgi:hypothetical protein